MYTKPKTPKDQVPSEIYFYKNIIHNIHTLYTVSFSKTVFIQEAIKQAFFGIGMR